MSNFHLYLPQLVICFHFKKSMCMYRRLKIICTKKVHVILHRKFIIYKESMHSYCVCVRARARMCENFDALHLLIELPTKKWIFPITNE